jgi:hypothetical protein
MVGSPDRGLLLRLLSGFFCVPIALAAERVDPAQIREATKVLVG